MGIPHCKPYAFLSMYILRSRCAPPRIWWGSSPNKKCSPHSLRMLALHYPSLLDSPPAEWQSDKPKLLLGKLLSRIAVWCASLLQALKKAISQNFKFNFWLQTLHFSARDYELVSLSTVPHLRSTDSSKLHSCLCLRLPPLTDIQQLIFAKLQSHESCLEVTSCQGLQSNLQQEFCFYLFSILQGYERSRKNFTSLNLSIAWQRSLNICTFLSPDIIRSGCLLCLRNQRVVKFKSFGTATFVLPAAALSSKNLGSELCVATKVSTSPEVLLCFIKKLFCRSEYEAVLVATVVILIW